MLKGKKMNRFKQLDARLDAWCEARWPGSVKKSIALTKVLAVGMLFLIIVWAALKFYHR
jgi:hypothetical protein